MPKISFQEWKNSMSFMIDDDFDNNFLCRDFAFV